MVFHKIVAEIKSKSKSFLLSLVIRLIWSILVSVFLTLLSIFSAYLVSIINMEPPTTGLSQILVSTFGELFIFFFSFAFPLIVLIYVVRAISRAEWEWKPKFSQRLETRLRRLHIETRIIIDSGLKWISRLSFLIAFLIMFMWLGANTRDDVSLDLWADPLAITIFLVSFTLTVLRYTLMTQFDWTVFYLEKFRKDHQRGTLVRGHLINAFRNYNRLSGSTITMNRLWRLCGLVIEAYKISDDTRTRQIDDKILEVIQRLKNEEVIEANRCLIQLAESTEEITRRHEELLGLKIKYPLRYRLGDAFKGTLNKIIIPFAVFLLYLLVWIILSHFGLFPAVPQPSPF